MRPSQGPGLSFDDALSRVLAGVDADFFSGLRLVPSSQGSFDGKEQWLEVTMARRTDRRDGSALVEGWEASLVAGAVAELMRTDETETQEVIGGVQILGPRGEDSSGGSVTGEAGRVFASQRLGESDQAITSAVTAAITDLGLPAPTVRVLHPLGPAIEVTVTVTDDGPAPSWTVDDLLTSLGRGERYEGIYLELVGPDGTPLLRTAGSYRTGQGSLWFAPGQDQRFGAAHG